MIKKVMTGWLLLFFIGCGSSPVPESPASSKIEDTRDTPGYTVAIEIDDTLIVPDNVTYHTKSKTDLLKAARVVEALCTREVLRAKDFNSFVTCGPYVWPHIANRSQFRLLNGPEMEIMGINLTGKYIIDDREGAMEVFLFLRDRLLKNRSITIRTLTEEEIIILWECISFDMEDPLFIIEGKNSKILIHLAVDNTVSYLDDFYGVLPGGMHQGGVR